MQRTGSILFVVSSLILLGTSVPLHAQSTRYAEWGFKVINDEFTDEWLTSTASTLASYSGGRSAGLALTCSASDPPSVQILFVNERISGRTVQAHVRWDDLPPEGPMEWAVFDGMLAGVGIRIPDDLHQEWIESMRRGQRLRLRLGIGGTTRLRTIDLDFSLNGFSRAFGMLECFDPDSDEPVRPRVTVAFK